jgi:hypothetical protein
MMKIFLMLGFLVGLISNASADTIYVDLNSMFPTGVINPPCYCGSGGPVYTYDAPAGTTINFGTVNLGWVFVGGPDSGTPNQIGYPDSLYIQSLVNVSYTNDNFYEAFCPPGTDPTSCGLHSTLSNLIFTIPAGDDSVEVGWFSGSYMAPAVPEPSTWAMLMIGFAAIRFSSRKLIGKPLSIAS